MAKLGPLILAVALLPALVSTQAIGKSPMSMDRLEPTGEPQFCISGDRIRRVKIVDSSTILFLTYDKGYFVNKLPRSCSGLKLSNGYSFDTRGTNDLCSSTTIDVFNSHGKTGQFCALGKFQKMVRKEDAGESEKTQ